MALSPKKPSGSESNALRLDASLTGTDVATAGMDMAIASAAGPGPLGDCHPPSHSHSDLIGDTLIESHYAVVYRYAYRLSGCAWAAEDITQETFVQAISHREQLRVAEAERGWVLSIARRAYLRWLRTRSRPTYGRTVAEAEVGEAGPWQEPPAGELGSVEAHIERQDWLQAALSKLGEDARLALVMYYFEELSYAEIAEQLRIPIGTVMSRLSRARGQLRGALEQAEQAGNGAPQISGDARRADAPSIAWPSSLHTKPIGQEARHG